MLAACGQAKTGQEQANQALSAQPATASAIGNAIACAPQGATDFTRACTLERTGDTVIVRNPDGGFHRLLVAGDGNVTAADGAEAAQVTARTSGEIEVAIGGDRYRLPPSS